MPAFEEALVREFKRAEKCCWGLGFLHVALESHDEGSPADGERPWIQRAAESMKCDIRAIDQMARLGTESFCFLLVDITSDSLSKLAERLRETVAGAPRAEGSQVSVAITGVACLPSRDRCSLERFLTEIDACLDSEDAAESRRVSIRSLIDPEDERRLVDVRSRRLSQWLEKWGKVDKESIRIAASQAPGGAYSMGRLARRLEWISPRRLYRILQEQKRTKWSFGEVAERLGYLRREQVFGLLALQQENPETLLDVLVQRGCVDDAIAQRFLDAYYESLRLAGRS